MSIKNRIYLSFFLLVSIFVINGVLTIYALNNIKKLSKHISEVFNPSIEAMGDFQNLIVESKMYSTNWVFLRYRQEDKNALLKIQRTDYVKMKGRLATLASKWENKALKDSLNSVFINFEILLRTEKEIANSLKNFEDYDDPEKKLGSEDQLENIVLPQSKALVNSLNYINVSKKALREAEQKELEYATKQLLDLIILMAIIIILLGTFLSVYMSNIIITPINKIRNIVNDLGKGIIKNVKHKANGDEIGDMVKSVNNLSDKLELAATFAQEIGNRNFATFYQALSEHDTLGKALLTMRDNLQSSDETLNKAQHIAHLGNWVKNEKNNKIFWSDEMYNIMDADSENYEYMHTNFLNYVHLDDKDKIKSILQKYYREKIAIESECRITTQKGKAKHIKLHADFVFDESGQIVKTFGLLQDITARKKDEEAIQLSEKRFRSLIENNADAITLLDNELNVLYQSPAAERMLGYSFEELKLKDVQNNIHPDDVNQAKILLSQVLKNPGASFQFQYRKQHKTGHYVWVEGTITNMFQNESVNAIVLNFRDVTERKIQQDTIENSNKELRKSNLELDRFVYSISHDLRAPLLSMLGVVEITEDATDEELTNEHMKMLKASINRLDKLIGEILDYSRNARNEISHDRIDFKKLLEKITHDLKFRVKSMNPVSIQIDIKEKGTLYSDNERLSMVLNNLVSNAINYYNPKQNNPYVKINIITDDNRSVIEVEDNGIGISNEFHQKIFEMFYRCSENSIGSGLGLYIVKETVDKLHGQIQVESQPGLGTKFRLNIPNLCYQ